MVRVSYTGGLASVNVMPKLVLFFLVMFANRSFVILYGSGMPAASTNTGNTDTRYPPAKSYVDRLILRAVFDDASKEKPGAEAGDADTFSGQEYAVWLLELASLLPLLTVSLSCLSWLTIRWVYLAWNIPTKMAYYISMSGKGKDAYGSQRLSAQAAFEAILEFKVLFLLSQATVSFLFLRWFPVLAPFTCALLTSKLVEVFVSGLGRDERARSCRVKLPWWVVERFGPLVVILVTWWTLPIPKVDAYDCILVLFLPEIMQGVCNVLFQLERLFWYGMAVVSVKVITGHFPMERRFRENSRCGVASDSDDGWSDTETASDDSDGHRYSRKDH